MNNIKKTLWTFGCSFTAEYQPIDNLHPPYENNYDKYKKLRGGNLPKTWPVLLSEKLDYDIMNCAQGGASNYSIIMQFNNISNLIKSGDILIFGWTKITRFLAANFDENIFNDVLPFGATYESLGYTQETLDNVLANRTHPIWKNEIRNWIFMINSFCKNIGAKDYHWTSDETIFNGDEYNIFNDDKFIVVRDKKVLENPFFTDKHSMMWYLTHCENYNGKFIAKIIDETNGEVPDGHLGEFGHKFQCEFFYNHIKNK